MINKKRQELIIQNLNSISAEVKLKSIEQLMQLPQMPDNEKKHYLLPLASDSDDEVKKFASEMIARLQSGSEPAASLIPSVPLPRSAPVSLPSLDLEPPSVEPSPAVAPVVSSPVSLPAVPVASAPVVRPAPAPIPVKTPATFVDDPIDPALPDIKKINDVPTLFQHIKMLADKKPSGFLSQLLQLSRSMLEEVALTALQTMLNLKSTRVASQILIMLADEQYSSQRRFLMLKIIMETDQDLDCQLLQEILLREKDVIVKSGLVKVFARSSRESGIPTLIMCLEDQDPRVRANTVEVIEEQNIRGCEQKIIQLLEDPENRVKVNAAKYLVKNGYQQAFLTLRAMLVSPEVWLRDSVIFALGEIGDQASLTLLKAALKDPNQGIRLSVLKALARINNNTSRQVLKAACGDPDQVIAQVANSLFEKIKDTPMREDPKPVAPIVRAPAAPPPVVPPVSLPPATAPAPQAPAVLPSIEPVMEAPKVKVETTPSLPSMPVRMPAGTPAQPSAFSVPSIPRPVAPPASGLTRPVLPKVQVHAPVAPVTAAPGAPAFAKPRSAEIFARLSSDDLNAQRTAAKDIAFVMGDDQMILLSKAVTLADESIRIAAVKLLSRKKTPEVCALLQKLTADPNETVRSLAEKTLLLLK